MYVCTRALQAQKLKNMAVTNNTLLESIGQVLYGGINPSIPGHGGEKCVAYLSRPLMIVDTSLATFMMIVVMVFALKTYTLPKVIRDDGNPFFKRFLLVFISVLFGIEICYKICSKQLLYILNPCHVITLVEITLLASKPSKFSYSLLRILIHYLYGALIAMLLPDTMSRKEFAGEKALYWVQHFIIFFVIPPYLVYLWGKDSLEPFKEWAWSCFSGSIFAVHHLYIMQPIALMTHVNLNFVMCPASKDPFRGPYYRLLAIFHQALCLLFSGKVYTAILRSMVPLRGKVSKSS